jgi:hypothetical protein
MVSSRTERSRTRASSETLGVAVLIGMTLLVTAGLGVGVMMISDQEQQQTADISFTFLSDTLVVVYQDGTERTAGDLYIDGPANNVSWAELDEELGPEDAVTQNTEVRLNSDTAYGSQPAEEDTFEVIYFTGDGQRFVLASVNADGDGSGDSPAGPGGPTGPDGPGGPGGPGG